MKVSVTVPASVNPEPAVHVWESASTREPHSVISPDEPEPNVEEVTDVPEVVALTVASIEKVPADGAASSTTMPLKPAPLPSDTLTVLLARPVTFGANHPATH